MIPCPIAVLLLRAGVRGFVLVYKRHNLLENAQNGKLQDNRIYCPAKYFALCSIILMAIELSKS